MSSLEPTSPRKRGPAKQWRENINLRLPEGAKARMDAVLEDGEDRLDLIRGAIDKEVMRREKTRNRATVTK